MVAVFCLAALVSYSDRLILGVLVDPIRAELAISDAQVSVLQGAAFALIYVLAGVPLGRLADRAEELSEDLPEVARHCSEMERRADEAERELVQWKKVRFMADKVGDEFDGYITGVAAFGLFV